MNYFEARAGADGSRLLSGPRLFDFGGLGQVLNRTDLLEYTDNLRQEIEARGFSIRYFSGPMYTVIRIPAVAGTNEELIVKNAANTAQMNAWNVELEPLWEQLKGMLSVQAQVTPLDNVWGSAGMPVPAGYTVNYAGLPSAYYAAVESGDVALANDLARQINAITAKGPIEGGVPFEGLPAGEVMSRDQLEAKRIRDFVASSPPHCLSESIWAGIAPSVRQYLSPDLVCRPSVETGGFDPGTVFTTEPLPGATVVPEGFAAECAPGYTWDGKACVPMESVDMFNPPGPYVEPTVVPVSVKPPKPPLEFGTESFVPTEGPGTYPVEEETPVTTAGFGGGALGMLALLGLGLAVLAAPKRKR